MLWILLACTVGAPDHATPGSPAATEAAALTKDQTTAGRLAGTARELESAARQARTRIEAGGDPSAELTNLNRLMSDIEEMEQALQDEHAARTVRIRSQAQSTAETTE